MDSEVSANQRSDEVASPATSSRVSRERFAALITLVPLLLSALILPFFISNISAPLPNTKKRHAQRTATELRTAILNYYSEYKRFPVWDTPSTEDINLETTSSSGLMGKLIGDNPRGILFFDENTATQDGYQGLSYPDYGASSAELLDPWGQPYHLILDTSDDSRLTVPRRGASEGTEMITKGAAVWSTGPDRMLGGPECDDIYAY